MTEELNKFLKFLFAADTGYVYSPLKYKNGEWLSKYFQWPSEAQSLHDWIETSKEEGNVYLAPGIFNEKSATKESFKHANVVWVEFDGVSKIEFKDVPEPDVVIQTSSSDKQHCYWAVRKANSETVEDINRRLTYHLRADNSGWDCTQVLRPPGTFNYKYAKPIETSMIKFKPPMLKREHGAFDKAPEIEKPPFNVTYQELFLPEQVLESKSLPPDLVKMVTKELVLPGNRSTFLMRLGYLLNSAGLNELEIVSLLYIADTRVKKFVGRSDQLRRLSEIAAIACLEVSHENYIEGYSPSQIITHELELEWRIEGWLHSYGIMILTGQPGVGKTQFSFDIAHKLTTGESLLGKPPTNPIRVAFLSLEMDIIEAKYIFVHQGKDFNARETANLWNENLKIYAPDGESSSFGAYEKILREFKPEVLIIDSLSELATDDLKETEARSIMRWIRRMSKEFSCGIIIIHHNRKASDSNKKPRKLGDLYGSYIFAKTASTVVSLWQEDNKEHIDLDELKVRFGERKGLKIKRTQNLTFEESKEDADKQRKGPEGNSNPLLNFSD